MHRMQLGIRTVIYEISSRNYRTYYWNNYVPKGQLISKCPFGVNKSTKKTNKTFVRISALASKKRSNQKSSVRESK